MPSTIHPFTFESASYDAVISSAILENITLFKVVFERPEILRVFGKEFQYMYKDGRLISVTPETNKNANLVDYFHKQILEILLNDPAYHPKEDGTGIANYDPSKM